MHSPGILGKVYGANDQHWVTHKMLGWRSKPSTPFTQYIISVGLRYLLSAYGYLWWVNRDGPWVEAATSDVDRVEGEGRLMPTLPESIFMAKGLQNQLVVIDPDHDIVFTRIGGEADVIGAAFNGALASDPEFANDLTVLVLGSLTD